MLELVIGKSKQKKKSYIKEQISKTNKPVIILNFKGEYKNIDGKHIDLGLINPFLEPLSLKDVKAINAGAAEYHSYLDKRAEQILKDYTPENEDWRTYRYSGLVQEAIERCLGSWRNDETQNITNIRRHLSFKKIKQTNRMKDVIEESKGEKVILLDTNGLHSRETRILTFLYLTRFLDELGSFCLVSDNINNMWKDGHLFNLKKIFDFAEIDAFFSFNKMENVPDNLRRGIDKITAFQLDSNKDYEALKGLNGDIPEQIKHLKSGEFVQVS